MFSAAAVEQDTVGHPGGVFRRQYWVLPNLQGLFIKWMVATSAVIATTASWVLLLLVWGPMHKHFVWAGQGIDADTFFIQMMGRVLATTGLLVLLFGGLSFLLGLFVSHRVAGPLHRLGRVAGDAAAGRYGERVMLRERDYIHGFADKFNTMLRHFEERHTAHRRAICAIEDELIALTDEVRAGNMAPDDVERRVRASLDAVRGSCANEGGQGDGAG